MLAPLFDMMLTDEVQACFTTHKVLKFLKQVDQSLIDEQCHASIPHVYTDWKAIRHQWDGLPINFVKEWSKYRCVKVGWTV
jgi:hypothetical protein